MKPTILLVSFVFSPNLGGIETHLDDLCAELTKKGHVVTVMTYQPLISSVAAPIIEKHDRLAIIRIPWFKGNLYQKLEKNPLGQILYLVPPILFCSLVYLFIHRRSIRVVQTHGFIMAIAGAILSLVTGIPFTVHTHVSFRFQRKSLYARLLSRVLGRAKRILVLTEEAKTALETIGVKKEILSVYHYWVDPGFYPRGKAVSRIKLGFPENGFIILFVGRLITDKGVEIVLKATEKLPHPALFVLAGSGSLEKDVRFYATHRSNARFVGVITRENLPFYYSAADVSVIPSKISERIYTEGIPRVMVESFSCGTPVVATNAGGLKTYMNTNVGFIISPDVTSLVKKLSWIMKNRKVLPSMSHHCVALSQSEFSMERNLKIIEASLL